MLHKIFFCDIFLRIRIRITIRIDWNNDCIHWIPSLHTLVSSFILIPNSKEKKVILCIPSLKLRKNLQKNYKKKKDFLIPKTKNPTHTNTQMNNLQGLKDIARISSGSKNAADVRLIFFFLFRYHSLLAFSTSLS